MTLHTKTNGALRSFIVLCLLWLTSAVRAEVIRVTGTVVDDKSRPTSGIYVVDNATKQTLAVTDDDGKFAVNVMSDGILNFTCVGYDKQSIKVKGRSVINVKMHTEDVSLGEAGVKAKRIINKVKPEPTVLEIKGNFLHISNIIRIPKEMFNSDNRLVIQPVLSNLTKGTDALLKPVVFDGKEYNITQRRMYGYQIARDSLSPFIKVKNDSSRYKNQKGEFIGYYFPYSDSIYVPNAKHNFLCEMDMSLEDYQKIYYGDTTIVANGTVNPLRFLDYQFGASNVTDPAYLPKQELQLRDGKGDINLRFPLGESKLDLSDATNRSELDKLEEQLRQVETQKGTALRDFSIMGTASPDGNYNFNLKLARSRMQYALQLILDRISAESRSKMKVSSDASVASWKDLVALLRADTLDARANEIEGLMKKYRSAASLYNAIHHLPYYGQLEEKYLPRLRRSQYSFTYTLFRQLTLEEIRQLYAKDYHQLSRFEFWKLYSAETDEKIREKYIHQSLEVYPSFMVAANDLAVILIHQGHPDQDLLARFAGEKAPAEVNMNHIIALLDGGAYSKADTIASYLPHNERTKLMIAVTEALNGKYAENYPIIAQTGKRNEVLMLLAMKKNADALKKCEELPETEAMTYYLRATCYNRLERVNEALDALDKAFEMDPNLKKVAKTDGDINKLLPKEDMQDTQKK